MNSIIFVLMLSAASALAFALLDRMNIGFVPEPPKSARIVGVLIAALVGAVLALVTLGLLS